MNYILDIISLCIDGIFLFFYFQIMFVKRKNKISLYSVIACFSFSELAYYFITIFSSENVSVSSFYFRILLNIFINFILSFFYSSRIIWRVFVVICYTALTTICEDIAYFFIKHFTEVNIESDTLPNHSFIAISLICNLLQLLIIFLLHNLRKSKNALHSITYSILLLLIPFLSICLILSPPYLDLIFSSPNTYILLLLFLLLINIANYILLENVLKLENYNQKNKHLEEQLSFQSQKYVQLSEAYRNIRSFMHDAKKHLFYIEECVAKEQYDQIIPYTRHTMNNLESHYCTINTGNLVIDSFISNYILQTKRCGIELSTNLKINSNKIPIDDYHLTIILGNLLDNAFNACSNIHLGKIHVTIQTIEDTFTIYITNTYIPDNDKKQKNIEEIDFIHGYGLQNVKNTVSKCGGIILINYENSIYSVTVIFPQKQESICLF